MSEGLGFQVEVIVVVVVIFINDKNIQRQHFKILNSKSL